MSVGAGTNQSVVQGILTTGLQEEDIIGHTESPDQSMVDIFVETEVLVV